MTETTAVAEYNPIAAGLAAVRQRYENVAWDLKTTKGNADARAARKELVSLRTGLEAKRKALKAPALEFSRRIDSEAARIQRLLLAREPRPRWWHDIARTAFLFAALALAGLLGRLR